MKMSSEYEGGAVGIMFFLGLILTLTGVGAIIGIPMMIVAVMESRKYK
jgi:hypothetical protein